MWGTIGYLKYQFRVEDLKKVIKNMRKIKQLPKGYMYPELHSQPSMPEELIIALARAKINRARNSPE